MSDTAPAGWYPAGVPGQERFWDGAQWTDQVRALAVAPSPAPARAPRTNPLAGYWRATGALARGDVDGAYAATEGSALRSWIVPLTKNAIVFGFLYLGVLAWQFQLPAAFMRWYMDITGTGALIGAIGGNADLVGSMLDPGAAGGVLAGAFFVGLGIAAGYLALRAAFVVLAGRAQGTRIGYVDALGIVGTAHILTPWPLAVAALLCLVPGILGGLLVFAVAGIGGVLAIIVAEAAIAHRLRSVAARPGSAFILGVFGGGIALVLAAIVAFGLGVVLGLAGYGAIFGGIGRALGNLGGLFG